MRGHAHYHLFWRVADRGNFQSLWKGKQRSTWHPLPPLLTIVETSVADFREITSGSPKTRKSQNYAGLDTISHWGGQLPLASSNTPDRSDPSVHSRPPSLPSRPRRR